MGEREREATAALDFAMLVWMLRTLYKLAKNTAIGGLGLGGALLALLVAFQEKLIYVPNAPGLAREYPFQPTRLGLAYEDVWLTTEDNVKIHCWYLPFVSSSSSSAFSASSPKDGGKVPTVLWLQENAGNMAGLPQQKARRRRQEHSRVWEIPWWGGCH